MKKQVLINVEDSDIRIAILENGELHQLFVESKDDRTIVGNIYKGKVASIVPGLKAAFVDIGQERNAFLHFSDIHREFSVPLTGEPLRSAPSGEDTRDAAPDEDDEDQAEVAARRGGRRNGRKKGRPLQVGDELLVQVTKDPISTKGARISTYISLPGRYLVLLPNSDRDRSGGISRRIDNSGERKRLRSILKTLDSEGNFIIRTAGLSQDESSILSNVKLLKKLWERIEAAAAEKQAPSLIHDDHEIIGRLVRDEFTDDISEIIIDDKAKARELRHTLATVMPDLKRKVTVYGNVEVNLFDKHEVESQFQKALRRRVWLKSGGYLVIDEAEAMVVIDVNTGKFVGKGDQEETILQTNLEAAQAIARQLRLRDVGGIVVIDFIDMRSKESQRQLVSKFKEYLREDRAKTFVGSISDLGLLEMTRKRVRQSLAKVLFDQCPYCQGSGRVLTHQQIWKNIKYEILSVLKNNRRVKSLQITTHPDIRRYLETEMLDSARAIANHGRTTLNFVDNKDHHIEHFKVENL